MQVGFCVQRLPLTVDRFTGNRRRWAHENAELAKRLRTGDEEVLYIDRGAAGEFIRGAVKG